MNSQTSFMHLHRRQIAGVVLLTYLLNPLLVFGQVIVNAGTPSDGRRAYVDQTQSGVTKINIATPNAAGLSHNSYQQFDVPKAGVVLNNGATNSNTRIAGWVEGNPNLKSGQEARLILNEVVGASASQLQGYIEVAGQKAGVIVANERGVSCNGCGFINTEQVTLSTGRPVIGADGALQQLRVQGGQVSIGELGLQAADSRVDILSQYVNVQGPVHAERLRVVSGANAVDMATGKANTIEAKDKSTPAGLDVSALGGMYANQITLQATGEGVGVRMDGKLISAGQLAIAADGTLVNRGQIQADGAIELKARRIEQSGQTQGAAAVVVDALQTVHSGQTQGQSLQLSGQSLDNSGALKALTAGLTLTLQEQLNNRAGGQILSQGDAKLHADSVQNAGQITFAGAATVQTQNLRNSGQVQTQSSLQVQATQLDNSGSLAAQSLSIGGQSLSNSGRAEAQSLSVVGRGDTASLANTGVLAATHIEVGQFQQINNSGKISTWIEGQDNSGAMPSQLTLQALGVSNVGGSILAAQNLDIQTGLLDNRQGTLGNAQGSITLQVRQLNNVGGSVLQQGAAGQLDITASEAVNNSSGKIEAQGHSLRIEAGELANNSGQLLQTAQMQAGQSQPQTQPQTQPQMRVVVKASDTASGQLQNIQGRIASTGDLQIAAQAVVTDATDPRRSQTKQLQFMDKAKASSGNGSTGSAYNWQADIAANEKLESAKADADKAATAASTAANTLTRAQSQVQSAQSSQTQTAADLTQAKADLKSAQDAAASAKAAAEAAPQDAALARAAADAQAKASDAQKTADQASSADQQAKATLLQAQADLKAAQDAKTAADAANASAQQAYQQAQAEIKNVEPGSSGSASAADVATGTSLQDNLKTGLVSAFISAGAGQSANAIGDVTKDSQALKALAHALAGCMAGGASGGKQGCESGAVGAVVGELAAQWYDSPSGSKKPEDVLNFVKVVSAAAGALTGDGSAASVSTAVMTGVNAAMNNRLMHFDEKERIRIAAGGDADKQERLTKAACFEIKCWAQFPEGSDLYKTNYVSVAEMSGLQAEWDWVKGQKNFGAFNYTPSQKFTDWVASNTGLASGTLNGKVLGAATNKACASGDTSCLTGIGQQQNPALTEAEKKARAEYFGNLGEEYQRSANLAASMRLPQVALSYEIAAALTGLLEQVYEPSIGKVITESLVLDRSIQAISDKMGIPRLFVEEISNAYIKPRLQVISDAMDKAGGYKK